MVATPSSTMKPKCFHDCVGEAEPRNAVIRKNLSSPPKERRIHEHRGGPADLHGGHQRPAPGGVGQAGRPRAPPPAVRGGGRRPPESPAPHRGGPRRAGVPPGAPLPPPPAPGPPPC